MRRLTVVAALAALVVLAGCTAAPPLAAPDTTSGSRPPDAAPVPAPTPRIPLDCDSLVDADAIATEFGVVAAPTPWQPPLGGVGTAYTAQGDLALLQAGALLCTWGTAEGTDPALVVRVIPAAIDLGALSESIGVSPASPDARETCDLAGELPGCALWIPLESTTTFVRVWADPQIEPDLDAVTEDARTFALGLAQEVTVAQPVAPRWEPAVSTVTVPPSCSALIENGSRLTSLGALTGDATLSTITDPLAMAALAELGGLGCAWSGQLGGTLETIILPGGAWAWDTFSPRSTTAIDYTPRADLGERAVTAGGDGEYLVEVIAGGALIVIRGDVASVEELVDVARAQLNTLGWVG